jgi:hypothetical protein
MSWRCAERNGTCGAAHSEPHGAVNPSLEEARLPLSCGRRSRIEHPGALFDTRWLVK